MSVFGFLQERFSRERLVRQPPRGESSRLKPFLQGA